MAEESPVCLTQRAVAEATDGDASADAAVEALRLALHAARLRLPELHADGCNCGRMPGAQYVELGRLPAREAIRLAEVIAKGVTA